MRQKAFYGFMYQFFDHTDAAEAVPLKISFVEFMDNMTFQID